MLLIVTLNIRRCDDFVSFFLRREDQYVRDATIQVNREWNKGEGIIMENTGGRTIYRFYIIFAFQLVGWM